MKGYIDIKEIAQAIAVGQDGSNILPAELWRDIEQHRADYVIGDIAGRDSFAANILVFQQGPAKKMLPVEVHTAVEYGDRRINAEHSAWLRQTIKNRCGGDVRERLYIGDLEFWRLLNARFIGQVVARFGFYTPCIGCHLYFHACRMILAKFLGIGQIVSGERESHDGRLKPNQMDISINAYRDFLDSYGIRHLQPLRHVAQGQLVEELLQTEWREGKAQLTCQFSGNYKDFQGQAMIDPGAISAYLQDFLLPLARFYCDQRLSGNDADLEGAAAQFLQQLWQGGYNHA
jgi:hypothetical protein